VAEEFQGEGPLKKHLGIEALPVTRFRDNLQVIVPAEKAYSALSFLKSDCGYDMLIDVTAVDYLEYPDATDRFGVIYFLLDTRSGARVQVKTMVNDPDPTLQSVEPLWKSADWLERETYDMFGIRFEGHPDLRRILMPEEFDAFPLRKDYPLRGRGERHNFPVITRAES
jgi:NADH-quinone oxidoreductase subunit C